MSFLGYVDLEATLYFLFTTRRFSTGAPYTLAGTPVLSVYEENNVTQITAGVSVSADYDSVTGLNQATVVATAANGYEAGKRYQVVITTGTVDSVSVVGEVVGTFVVGNISADVKAISGDSTAADNAESFFDGTGYAGTNNVIPTVTTLTGHTAQTGDSYARIGAPAGASVSADIVAVKTDTGNLVTRITATLFSGITSLAEWLGLIAGKQVGNATALTEIKATGAGSGTFDPTTDSQEAIRDTAPLGTAMRGTDNAALASVCTEARLAELAAANLPADVDTLLTRLSAVRAGYLDNLSAGAVALEATLTAMKGAGWSDENLTTIDGLLDALTTAVAGLNDPDAAAVATAVMASVIETGYSLTQSVRLLLAASCGKLSGAATATNIMRDILDTKARITATVDADGNRTAVTLDGT